MELSRAARWRRGDRQGAEAIPDCCAEKADEEGFDEGFADRHQGGKSNGADAE